MNIRRIIANEMRKSSGRVEVIELPENKKASADSFRKLEREISAQVSANAAMCNRSMHLALRSSLK